MSSVDNENENNNCQENERKEKLKRHDSLDIEASNVKGHHGHVSKEESWGMILTLAFQSIGVVYGDLGTSPLYTLGSTFPHGAKGKDDILGVLSLIYYTMTLLPLIKYVFIVLRANDNGKGGTFALYSLLCRNAKVGLLPSQQDEDQNVSNYNLQLPSSQSGLSLKLKTFLENNRISKYVLLLVTMLSTSLVMGDGILTPSMSAVGGLKAASPTFTEGKVVWISVVILFILFGAQRYGTNKVGYSFAPILTVWFLLNAGIGVYNFFKYDPTIIKALNPWNIIQYFRRNGKEAWISLGGVVLCITGTEALFADVGHFSVKTIQISMSSLVYPSLILTYTGQAAYLGLHPEQVSNAYYSAIPAPIYWPMFSIAVIAAIIASQAMISGTFSIIQQSLALGCFPNVKVIHTSTKYEGQVYIPEVNFMLMLASIFVTLVLRTPEHIGHAYGIAVVFAETITSSYMVLVMLLIWKTHIALVILYVCSILSLELLYLSSVLYKFTQGGYLPILFGFILSSIMCIWNYVYRKKYYYEMDNKVPPSSIANRTNICRIPGIAIFYSKLVHGIPPIFEHYVENIPALHTVLIFVSIKSLPVSTIPFEERFVFRRVNPRDINVFRCVVRYGYADARNKDESFENVLMDRLREFLREDIQVHRDVIEDVNATLLNDIEVIEKAWQDGVVHMIGESEVMASQGSSVGKRIVIDVVFKFLKRNLRQNDMMFDVPHKKLVKVGMTCQL